MTRDRYAALKACLAGPDRPPGTMSYHQLQGFMFTIASAPDVVPPSEWLPQVFDGGEPVYDSKDQLESVLGQIMQLYNEVNEAILTHPASLPDDCPIRADAMANFDDDAPLAQWSRGFITGHQWLEASWEIELPQEMDEEIGSAMFALCFFGSRQIADAYMADRAGQQPIESIADTIRSLFPDALSCYAKIGRTIGAVTAEVQAEAEAARRAPKVGRNAPCPCGSGRKYKKCCGANVH
jgi:uncharacterized protein